MVKAPTEADLNRLRQFLEKLESDARIAVGDIDVDRHEIAMLKHEIAYLEDLVQGVPVSDRNKLRGATFSVMQPDPGAAARKMSTRDRTLMTQADMPLRAIKK